MEPAEQGSISFLPRELRGPPVSCWNSRESFYPRKIACQARSQLLPFTRSLSYGKFGRRAFLRKEANSQPGHQRCGKQTASISSRPSCLHCIAKADDFTNRQMSLYKSVSSFDRPYQLPFFKLHRCKRKRSLDSLRSLGSASLLGLHLLPACPQSLARAPTLQTNEAVQQTIMIVKYSS